MREIRGDFIQLDLLGRSLPIIAVPEKLEVFQNPIRLTNQDLSELPVDYLRDILRGIFNINIPKEIRRAQNYSETLFQIYAVGKLKWGSFDFDHWSEDFFELSALLESTARQDLHSIEEKLNSGYLKFNDPWKTRMERLPEHTRKAFVASFFSKYADDACAYELKAEEPREGFVGDVFQKLDRYIPIN